ncbi:hypothetical protein EBB59_01695 [Lysobacter pythonis]|uniref:Uncharacterized protein n=1 Tax=Solilutibacter pythonis TaxID=2483112 RepID=A0A3M2I493_9GAMM|nr:hypothetical protein [Lysobacter pythonis]RMH94429.1 hypothetical protein EBB59_01695 [Lysobacter pythonis]
MTADFLASKIEGYSSNSLDERTVRYLENYWTDRESFKRDWVYLLESVFKRASGKVSVAGNLVADFMQGGILFTEDEFSSFVARTKESGATRFAVVEDIGQSDWGSLKELDFLGSHTLLELDGVR